MKKRRLFGERPNFEIQKATFWEANTPKHERNPANHTTLLSYIAIKETRTQTHEFTNLTMWNEKKALCRFTRIEREKQKKIWRFQQIHLTLQSLTIRKAIMKAVRIF